MKKHYELIRPLEEETVSSRVLNLYNEICKCSTIPWAIFTIGEHVGNWETDHSRDFVFHEYAFRVADILMVEIARNAQYNIELH